MITEGEVDGDEKYLNMSARGLKETLDLTWSHAVENADFSNNAITQLDWSRIETAPNLTTLDLSGNVDLVLPENGPGVEMPLNVLNMSNCNVEVISRNALSGLKNLEVLDLRGNPIAFEKCGIFENLEAPPKLFIISKISKDELEYVCKQVDMKVEIIDDDMTFDCKDVRRKHPKFTNISPTREKLSSDVMLDEMILPDTHMEMQMMVADEPMGEDEGSGMIEENEKSVDTMLLTDTLIPNPESSIVEDTTDKKPTTSSEVVLRHEEHQEEISGEHQTENHDEHQHENHDDHESMLNESKEKLQIQPKQPMQKTVVKEILVDTPPQINITDAVIGENKTSEASTSTGKSVILVLVIGAVAMGSVFGLMKVYKDRQRYAGTNTSDTPDEGKEMKEIFPERLPLISNATNGAKSSDEKVPDVVVVDGKEDNPQPRTEMTTKEILNNPDTLPDIDDPSRLSTVIVSNTNLNDVK